MLTIKLNVIKKNRVYFKCENERGYEVKLKVTPVSENLSLGMHELLVHDVSIRTKYGTDIIYTLESELKSEDGIVALEHRYNCVLVEKCRELGGKWDSTTKTWAFPKIVEDEVEKLEFNYNIDIIFVEIKALSNHFAIDDSVYFKGYPIATATGRDSGARVSDDVSLISGRVTSGGSLKNWATKIDIDSIFRLKISKNLLGLNFENDADWEIKEI